jgi:leader peptidase (prepilin peptidase)/N-methyltransferase
MTTLLLNGAWAQNPLLLVAAAGLGACLGSFSNVLIYRLPRNLQVARGRSRCPACGGTVAWYDNVPVLSWLLLRGRCRACRVPIPVRYPLVELGGALCAVAGIMRFGWTVEGLSASVFLLLLLAVAVIDWEHMIIPHTLTVGGGLIGLVLSLFAAPGLPQALLGAVVGAGVILGVNALYKAVRGVAGMGGGDVMLMGLVGVYLGPWGVWGVLFGGAFLGTVYAIAVGRGRVRGGAKLPFGTFLAAAAAIVLMAGEALLGWYLARF